MIRSNIVKLNNRRMIAYRRKLKAGDSAIVLMSADTTAVGLATLSKRDNEPIISANTDVSLYPLEAFKEAAEMTMGMPYHKQGSVKVSADMFVEETAEEAPEEVEVDLKAYEAVVAAYSDKTGKLSYSLLNKDLIRFAHSSSIVRKMVADAKDVKEICKYIVSSKIRHIVKNPDLPEVQVDKIVELLDEVSPKSVTKELSEELRKMLKKGN